MAKHFARRMAGKDGVGFGLLQDGTGGIFENELQKVFQAGQVCCLRSQQGSSAFAPGEMFRGRFSHEPLAIVENGKNVGGRERDGLRGVGWVELAGHDYSGSKKAAGELIQRCDHVTGDGFTASDGVHAFIGFGFEVNFFRRDMKSLGEHFAHF